MVNVLELDWGSQGQWEEQGAGIMFCLAVQNKFDVAFKQIELNILMLFKVRLCSRGKSLLLY